MTRKQMYPPIPHGALVNCFSFENIDRVVVTEDAVYGRTLDGAWIRFMPKCEAHEYDAIGQAGPPDRDP